MPWRAASRKLVPATPRSGGGRLGRYVLVMAKPATAGVALKLIEEKGVELSDEIVTRVSTGQAERIEQIEVGHSSAHLCP